jgi:hypothetical protein
MANQVQTDILGQVQQDAPVLLKASDFNLQTANTDGTDISHNINRKILKVAWHQICASVFTEICTGYTNQLQAALNHIKQCYINSNGNQFVSPFCVLSAHDECNAPLCWQHYVPQECLQCPD